MRRATAARATLAAAAVLALGALLLRALTAGSSPPSTAAASGPNGAGGAPRDPGAESDEARAHAQPRRAIAGFTLSNVTGPVERRTRDGAWVPVHAGETIQLAESLRTLPGGAAVLELQDHTTIWLWPESQVSADRLDDELARVGVSGGRLDLNVPRREAGRVEVTAEGGATAVTRGARFSIIVDGDHVATVATREGEVDVVSGTGRVRVPPGMQTRARPGQAPETVTPIPTELLLAVDWPVATLRSRSATIRGHAPPGVLVSVGGTRVVVSQEGVFEREVPLDEGENHLEVNAEDVVGRRVVRRSPTLRVDTSPPTVGTRGRWE